MSNYPVNIINTGESWFITFQDFPETIVSGSSKEETLIKAYDALIDTLSKYGRKKNKEIPFPSKVKEDQEIVSLPISKWVKVLLINEMKRQNVTQANLAKRLGRDQQFIQLCVRFHTNTTVDSIEYAIGALGKRLFLSIEEI